MIDPSQVQRKREREGEKGARKEREKGSTAKGEGEGDGDGDKCREEKREGKNKFAPSTHNFGKCDLAAQPACLLYVCTCVSVSVCGEEVVQAAEAV